MQTLARKHGGIKVSFKTFFKSLVENYQQGLHYEELVDSKNKLLKEHEKLLDDYSELDSEYTSLQHERDNLKIEIAELKEDLQEARITKEQELKNYWYNKYPKKASYSFGNVGRVKKFCKENNDKVPIVTGRNIDEKAANALLRVIRNIKYVSDVKEHWQTANETIEREAGDCFAGYSEIYTGKGLKRIKDIKVGDKVLSYDFIKGEFVYKPVIKHWSKGLLQINRVHFRNGQYIDVSEDHPMWVRESQKKSNYIKQPLSEIDLTKWWKRKVPIAKRVPYVQSQPKFDKDLYRVIGHYIAEGWTEGSHVCSSGYELVEDIIPLLEKHNISFSEYINNSGVPCIRFLKSDFKDYLKGLKRNSFDITLYEELINSPKEYLEELLTGMWLGDGTKAQYTDKRGYKNNREWTYSTSSEQLASDIQRIGLHLGKTFHIWKQDNHKGVGDKPIYRINYNPSSHFLKNFGYDDISEVSISSVEKLDKTEMFDLTVADTHTVVLKNGIITHQCEDGAILLYNIMVKSGVPAWRVRINAGDVVHPQASRKTIGHAYVSYLSEEKNDWLILDWCYWPEESKEMNLLWRNAKKYFGIWFSFNQDYIWIKPSIAENNEKNG